MLYSILTVFKKKLLHLSQFYFKMVCTNESSYHDIVVHGPYTALKRTKQRKYHEQFYNKVYILLNNYFNSKLNVIHCLPLYLIDKKTYIVHNYFVVSVICRFIIGRILFSPSLLRCGWADQQGKSVTKAVQMLVKINILQFRINLMSM